MDDLVGNVTIDEMQIRQGALASVLSAHPQQKKPHFSARLQGMNGRTVLDPYAVLDAKAAAAAGLDVHILGKATPATPDHA